MSPNPNESAVTFSNDVEEAAPVTKSAAELRHAKDRASLSASAKAWDLDGDGELDETELALKNLDRSQRGTLSKDQMYALMTENLKTQRELFKVKKVVAGLVAFTCILAISNLGTSLAAAFLAKDTTTTNNNLVDVKTNKVVGANSYTNEYVGNKDLADEISEQRRLENSEFALSGFTAFDRAMGREMVNGCQAGNSVTIKKCFDNNNPNRCARWNICPVHDPLQESIGGTGNDPSLTITNRSPTFTLQKDGNAYTATGLSVLIGGFCDTDADCGTNLLCQDKDGDGIKKCRGINGLMCAIPPNEGDDDNCASGHICETGQLPDQGFCRCTGAGETGACYGPNAGLTCMRSCPNGIEDIFICRDKNAMDQACVADGSGDYCDTGAYSGLCQSDPVAREAPLGRD